MHTRDGAATVYHSSKPRILMYAAGALFFIAIGVKLFQTGEASAMFVGLLAAFFFLTYLAVTLALLVRRSPELVITPTGFTHHRRGSLAWAEIDRIRVQEVGGHRFLEVLLHDPDAYLTRTSLVKRVLGHANRGIGYSPVTISTRTVRASLHEVAEAMRRHHPALPIEA
ncbi:hypothetical protein JMUB6875_02750 [Nocardia sp. JMUB6875]|uniref:STM3941 family protein n=1 Tax=Nocardia sp. JMUB6875 TaxID=3158170 RepID=UPI0032E5A597